MEWWKIWLLGYLWHTHPYNTQQGLNGMMKNMIVRIPLTQTHPYNTQQGLNGMMKNMIVRIPLTHTPLQHSTRAKWNDEKYDC